MSFEKNIEKLEKLSTKLENESCSIDESLKLYDEAIALAKVCMGELDGYKGKLELLTKDMNNVISRVNLDVPEEND